MMALLAAAVAVLAILGGARGDGAVGQATQVAGSDGLPFVPVFTPGELGYPCIRIPSILLAPDNKTLVAFAECRNSTGDGCYPSGMGSPVGVPESANRDVCRKRSEDGGKTWGDLEVVVYHASQPTAVADATTGSIVLSYLSSGASPGNYQVVSADIGVSWGAPQSLAAVLGPGHGCSNGGWAETGPGVGLQLSDEHPTAPGRLLFIGHCGAYQEDVVWYSDDNGKTYTRSNTQFTGMDEAQLVQRADGAVVANMRNKHLNKCDCRAISVSTDGGSTFGPITYDSTLISPVCMASVLTGPNGDMYFANPASTTARANGVVRRSQDGTKWTSELSVSGKDGLYAYSCLTLTPDPTKVGLLWETVSPGCSGASCQSVYSAFPADF